MVAAMVTGGGKDARHAKAFFGDAAEGGAAHRVIRDDMPVRTDGFNREASSMNRGSGEPTLAVGGKYADI